MSEIADFTYYQINWNIILNKAKDCYKNNKKRLREPAQDKYESLSEQENNKKREYGNNRYHNMSEEKKQRLKEYQKNYYKTKKSQYNHEWNSFLIVIVILIIMTNKIVFLIEI